MGLDNFTSQGDWCNGSAPHILRLEVLSGIVTVMGRRVAYHEAQDSFILSLIIIKTDITLTYNSWDILYSNSLIGVLLLFCYLKYAYLQGSEPWTS